MSRKEIKDLQAQLETALLELSRITGKSLIDLRKNIALKAEKSGIREQIEYESKRNSLANLEIGRKMGGKPYYVQRKDSEPPSLGR